MKGFFSYAHGPDAACLIQADKVVAISAMRSWLGATTRITAVKVMRMADYFRQRFCLA
jgi:hypothetical protein